MANLTCEHDLGWIREAIIETLASYDARYCYFGLRAIVSADHEGGRVVAGQKLPCSYVWDDGDWTDERLGGASTVFLGEDYLPGDTERIATDLDKALATLGGYYGDQLVLAVSVSREWGQDPGEAILHDATAIAVFDL